MLKTLAKQKLTKRTTKLKNIIISAKTVIPKYAKVCNTFIVKIISADIPQGYFGFGLELLQ